MSGIYGFSLNNIHEPDRNMEALAYWNRIYGHDGTDASITNDIGIGCCIEHLNDGFPMPPSIIHSQHHISVIDAVLYNRAELLTSLGLNTETRISDEQLLFDYLMKFGFDALMNVNGDFAGAIFDTAHKNWILFRDHSGVRPLFYYKSKDSFVFSTDLRGIAAIDGLDLKIDEEQFYLRMMGFNNLSLCGTEYEHIKCIRPASWTVVEQTSSGFRFNEHIYWKWNQKKIRLRSDEAYQAELRRLITDAIQRRLDAFPGIVGCELSGGLDSSVIAIIINRLGREGCFYSWSSPVEELPLNPERDERQIIFDICEQEKIQCHFYHPSKSKTSDEHPLHEVYPPYLSTRFIGNGAEFMRGQNARVVFSGHGGDEGVSHRCNLYELWYQHEYLGFLRVIYSNTAGMNLRVLRTLKNAAQQIHAAHKDYLRPFYRKHTNASCLVNQRFVDRLKNKINPRTLTFAYDPVSYIIQGGHRPRLDNLALQGADNGVRYMIPFIDYRVLDFALSIPRVQYKKGNTNRYIYRQAFHDMIPESLRNMRYKDMPSRYGDKSEGNVIEYFRKTKAMLLDFLNRDYWKDYLDMEAIEAYDLPQNYTYEEYNKTAFLLNDLSICAAIQNVAFRAREWSDNDE